MQYNSNVTRLEKFDDHWVAQRNDGKYFRLNIAGGQRLAAAIEHMATGRIDPGDLQFIEREALARELIVDSKQDINSLSAQKNAPPGWHVQLVSGETLSRLLIPAARYVPFLLVDLLAISAFGILVFVAATSRSMSEAHNPLSVDTHLLFEAFAFYFISIAAHELGHALACVKAAGSVGSMLLGFRGGLPMWITNASACYFSPIRHRVRVALAGVQFQLIAVAVIVCLVPNAKVSAWLSVLMLVALWFIVIPFMKNDGYWILADARGEATPAANALHRLLKRRPRRGDAWVVVLISVAFALTWFFIFISAAANIQTAWHLRLGPTTDSVSAISFPLLVLFQTILILVGVIGAWRYLLLDTLRPIWQQRKSK